MRRYTGSEYSDLCDLRGLGIRPFRTRSSQRDELYLFAKVRLYSQFLSSEIPLSQIQIPVSTAYNSETQKSAARKISLQNQA